MNKVHKLAAEMHKDVPPDWYYRSVNIDKNYIRKKVHLTRFRQVEKLIDESGGKILDIGCADGMFTKVILDKSKAEKIIGIDVLENSINWARKHWKKEKRMEFVVADAHKLPFKSRNFDTVVALEVLEHVFEPVKVLQEIKRVLKPKGYVVFLVPAETIIFKVVWYFWTKYTASRIWKETHAHAYSSDFLVKLMKMLGYNIIVDKKIIFGTLHLIKAGR
jgi:2-polyprenyl-3-methyl-5-hydroxy-6-metoxy-1,4-benzoquinol methylase